MQEAEIVVPPLSRRDRATRLRRLLGREPPSYGARANFTKQLETLAREQDKLENEISRCRRKRDGAREQRDKDILGEVADGLERVRQRYRAGLKGLKKP